MIVVGVPVEDHPGRHRERGDDHRARVVGPRAAKLSALRHEVSFYAVGVSAACP